MQQKIGTLRLALTFAGCFLGAGYVSGQELWQYFGAFGARGLLGLALAVVLLGGTGVLLLRLSARTGIETMDALIVRADIPWLRTAVGVLTAALLFGVVCIMAAGIGALGNQMLGLPVWLGAAIACVLIAAAAYFGLGGMVSVFTVAVPCMIVAALVIAGIRLHRTELTAAAFAAGDTNPMLGSWATSAVNYAAYNFFATVGILAPLTRHLKKPGTAVWGTVLGCVLLLAVALGVLAALATSPESTQAPLPMLDLACRLGAAGAVYAVLLFLGMFGTSVSSLVAVLTYAGQKSAWLAGHRTALLLVLTAAAFAGSLFGFGDLIGTVYPVYGYLGMAAMLLEELYETVKPSGDCKVIHDGSVYTLLKSFAAAFLITDKFRLSSVLQYIGVGIGILAVAAMAFTSGLSQAGALQIIMFVLIWTALVIFIPRFKKP